MAREVFGIFVISLNMPGSAAAADLIVTDPVQAGVMAVIAITVLMLVALVVSVPYWQAIGVLARP